MEIRQLKYLLAVADAGSLTQASRRVGLTQQALSRSLAGLEASLGGKLFEREARGVVLTRLGETVARHARDVMAGVGQLRAAAEAELGMEPGRVAVGLGPIASSTWIGHEVVRFAARHPGLGIDIAGGTDRSFTEDLHAGRLDLAVAAQTEHYDDAILVQEIGSEMWGVVGRAGHPLLSGAEGLRDVRGARWLVGRHTDLLYGAIQDDFDAAGLPAPQSDIVTGSVLFALTAVSQSDYLAILPRSICQLIPGLEWRALGGKSWSMPLYLLRHRRGELNARAKELIAELARASEDPAPN